MENGVNFHLRRKVELVRVGANGLEYAVRAKPLVVQLLGTSFSDDSPRGKPDFLTFGERWGRGAVPIVSAAGALSCALHLVSEHLMHHRKLLHEIFGSSVPYLRRPDKVGLELRVIPEVSEERRALGGGVRSVVVDVLSEWQKRLPVVLLIIDVDVKVLLDGLVHPFSLAVSLGVVHGGEVEARTSEGREDSPEVRGERSASIGDNVVAKM